MKYRITILCENSVGPLSGTLGEHGFEPSDGEPLLFDTGQGLYRDCTGQELDSTPDYQSLVLETDKGLVLVLRCCHAGLVNTVEHVVCMTGRRDVYAVIGGTHLGFCGQEQIGKTVAALRTLGIRKLAASHCTGFAASARLSRELPNEFQAAMVGYTVEI